jgi:hypothetical protein
MSLRVVQFDLRVHELTARMPFRYGIVTMTHLPHLLMRAHVEIDGRMHPGQSAENLAPKWFTKDPTTTPQQDIQQMLRVIRSACSIAVDAGTCRSVFELWRMLYQARPADDPPLLWGLGTSLVERAVIDAFCRATQTTFGAAMRTNRLGIELGQLYPELHGATPTPLLPRESLDELVVRHTVGLTDPITDAEIPEDQRIDDGLPQSLQACIDAYGLTHFKIKLGGDWRKDLERLKQIATLLDRKCSSGYAFTLDGNENYPAVEPFRLFWQQAIAEPTLRQFLSRLIFVEQPLHRDVALNDASHRELTAWRERPAMIIDESGGSLQALTQALDGGYVGASHKNCKGVIKGVASACLIEARRRCHPSRPFILSCEDLSNTGPIALFQDCAVAAALGVKHLERNGHHYFRGLQAWPMDVQSSLLQEHPDFLAMLDQGFTAVKIQEGKMKITSINSSHFGTSALVESACFAPAVLT